MIKQNYPKVKAKQSKLLGNFYNIFSSLISSYALPVFDCQYHKVEISLPYAKSLDIFLGNLC